MNEQELNTSPIKDFIQVDHEVIENIATLIEEQASKSLLALFTDLHSADIAEIINHLEFEQAVYAFKLLDTETAGEVITELDENLRDRILAEIETKEITSIIEELDADDATDIIGNLPDEIAEEVLSSLSVEDYKEVKELLQYPEDSAGGIMSRDFVYVRERATVKDAIREVRKNAEEFEHIYHVYVLRENDELMGIVHLKSLLINPLTTKITSVIDEELIYVSPDEDQEEVAMIMEKYDLVVIPVIDDNKKMLGRITIDDVVDVIQEEANEDIQKIAGLSEEQEASDSVLRITRIRLPWLIIALVMELVAAVVLSSYEAQISQFVVTTFFIPVVMAMGGSSGTQAAIVMVRGLSTGDIWLSESLRKLLKEFLVAMLNGISCAAILLVATILFFDAVTLSFSFLLSGALLLIIIISTMVGAIIPIFFKKFGADPAIATGPFVTTANDILGLLIYLTAITLFFTG